MQTIAKRGFGIGFWGGLFVFIICIAGCSLFPGQKALRQCRFEPMDYAFSGLNSEGILGALRIRAINPGKHAAKISRMQIWVMHAKDTLVQMNVDTTAQLPPHDTITVPMKVVLPYSAMSHLAGPLALGQKLECDLVGHAWIETPFGTYTLRNALHKPLVLDLAPARAALQKSLRLPWFQ